MLRAAGRCIDLRDQSTVVGSGDCGTRHMCVCRLEPADDAEKADEEHKH